MRRSYSAAINFPDANAIEIASIHSGSPHPRGTEEAENQPDAHKLHMPSRGLLCHHPKQLR
jgi:hypothetical protein